MAFGRPRSGLPTGPVASLGDPDIALLWDSMNRLSTTASGDLGTHAAANADVHGIADTSALVLDDDARLTDARTPLPHAASHEIGGDDLLDLDSITGELDGSKIYGSINVEDFSATGLVLLPAGTEIQGPLNWSGASDPFLSGLPSGSQVVPNLNAEKLDSEHGSFYLDRTNHTGTQDVSTLTPGADNGVAYVNSGVPSWGLLMDASIANSAAIGWSKISKTGSSLADLSTRSAGDLSSGNLAYARMPTGSGTWDVGSGNTLTLSRLAQFSLGVGIGTSPSAAIGLRVANVGQTGASQQSFNTDFTCGTDATTAAMGVLSRVRTPAAAMTCARASALYAGQPVVGAGSTITEAVGLLVEGMSTGVTNYAIRTLGSTRSLFGGAVEVDGDLDHDGAACGFYGVTPVARAAAITAPTGGATIDAEARTAVNAIRTALTNIGITS